MTYTGTERRIAALNVVKRAFEAQAQYKSVKIEIPAAPPSKLEVDLMVYIGTGTEVLTGLTNQEKDSAFRFSVLVFCRANAELELEKIRVSGNAEETIMALQNSADFIDKGLTMIDVVTIDRGPLALEYFGIQGPVLSPIGVVRLDTVVTFSYVAF